MQCIATEISADLLGSSEAKMIFQRGPELKKRSQACYPHINQQLDLGPQEGVVFQLMYWCIINPPQIYKLK